MSTPARTSLENALQDPRFADISELRNVRVDLRYGSTNNLLRRDVYGGFQRALLHKEAAVMFRKAAQLLQDHRPRWSFLIFDALRPHSAQYEFWRLVQGTRQEIYFADPERGSLHSYGFAIDLSLVTDKGIILDMGTRFDELTDLAQPEKEAEFLQLGKLSEAQVNNRKLLRNIMEEAGFIQLPHEWWHFDAKPGEEVRATHTRLD